MQLEVRNYDILIRDPCLILSGPDSFYGMKPLISGLFWIISPVPLTSYSQLPFNNDLDSWVLLTLHSKYTKTPQN